MLMNVFCDEAFYPRERFEFKEKYFISFHFTHLFSTFWFLLFSSVLSLFISKRKIRKWEIRRKIWVACGRNRDRESSWTFEEIKIIIIYAQSFFSCLNFNLFSRSIICKQVNITTITFCCCYCCCCLLTWGTNRAAFSRYFLRLHSKAAFLTHSNKTIHNRILASTLETCAIIKTFGPEFAALLWVSCVKAN